MTYQPLPKMPGELARILTEVARPWLETKKSLTAEEADLICTVCWDPTYLYKPYSLPVLSEPFSSLLANKPKAVGELIICVGKWRAKQLKTKKGRIRRVLEEVFFRVEEARLTDWDSFDYAFFLQVAKERKIGLDGVGKADIRARRDDVDDALKELAVTDAPPMPTFRNVMNAEGRWVSEKFREAREMALAKAKKSTKKIRKTYPI